MILFVTSIDWKLQNDFILEFLIYNLIFFVNFAKGKKGLVCIGVSIVHGEWLGKHRHLCLVSRKLLGWYDWSQYQHSINLALIQLDAILIPCHGTLSFLVHSFGYISFEVCALGTMNGNLASTSIFFFLANLVM